MGRSRYKFRETHYPFFITSSVIQGLPLFADPNMTSIILNALSYMQREKEVTLYAYMIMHNHIHLIAEGDQLSGKLQSFKSFTARSIIDYLTAHQKTRSLKLLKFYKKVNHRQSEYQVWEEGLHPKQISEPDIMNQKTEYIHYNPVKAGFVGNPAHWRYSSAVDYEGGVGLIPVTIFSG